MIRARLRRTAIAATLVALVAACGSTANNVFGEPPASGPDASTDPSSGGTGSFSSSAPEDSGPPAIDLNACATDKQQGKLKPLDLVLMQDTSGSMWGYTSGTTTKWAAIKQALGSFMIDPGSAGIGLGIQFFPSFENDVPNSCTTNAECGASGGSCIFKACSKTGALCEKQADCTGGNNTCTPLQRCATYQEILCLSPLDCAYFGLSPSTCNQPAVRGQCATQSVSCAVGEYSGLAAPITVLPGAAPAVNAALSARIPNGQTPTHSALQGAIAAAQAHAATRPDAVVAVVLSTDGIPNTRPAANQPPKCIDDPTAIAGIAAAAANPPAGTPPIKTFVIGVLSPDDNTAGATTTLNTIAASGGTAAATIIGASSTTQADFIAALQKIRSQSLPCEFALPVPDAGTPDYGKVNVTLTDPTSKIPTLIPYVTSAVTCDLALGGWYYDVDPATGAKPSKVVLCPATCTSAQQSQGGGVDVVQGCATQTKPQPK